MQHRLQQSWQAFHRLSSFLCSKQISLQQKLRLWKTCVQPIARYGLDAVGVDEVSAAKHRSHTARQLRRISGSIAHLTHESNLDLHARLGVADPVAALCDLIRARVEKARLTLSHLRTSTVDQWFTLLLSETELHRSHTISQKGELTEVTQVARIACSCDLCGQQFASFHALRTHIGKRRPEHSIAQTHSSYAVRATRDDSHLRFAKGGKPQCSKCLKKFSGFPAFMTHFNQKACPVTHAPQQPEDAAESNDVALACGASAPGGTSSAASDEPVPVFKQAGTVAVAQTGDLAALAKHIREHGQMDRCPECGVNCKPMYITRHACKQHAWLQQAHAQVTEWARQSQVPSNPCQWCGARYQTSNKAHRNACPTLWACGQLLLKYSQLNLPGQGSLHGYGWGRRADPSSRRAGQFCQSDGPSHNAGNDSTSESSFHGGSNGHHWKESGARRLDPGGPSQVARGQGKGSQQAQRPKGRPQQQQSWWDKDHKGYAKSNDDLKQVVKALGCLVLRQEDSLSVIQLDCQFIIFMRNPVQSTDSSQTPDWSVTKQLLSVGKHWRDRKAKDPKSLGQPLRTVLFSAWLTDFEARSDSARPFDDRGSPPNFEPAPAAAHPSQCDRPLPPAEEAHRGNGLRCHPLDLGNPEPHAGSASGIHFDREAHPQRMYPPCSINVEALQARPLAPSNSGGQDASRALRPEQSDILRLQLSNPHHHSYAHAVIYSILWTASRTQDGFEVQRQDLRKFLQWLSTQTRPQPIWQNLVWQALTKNWSHPLRHHDPAQFLHFLQPMIFAEGEGVWQARNPPSTVSAEPICQVSRSGHAWPILLPAAGSSVAASSLQQLVTQWHQQAQAHGLSALSPALALQTHRFDDRGNVVQFSITNEWRIKIPLFTNKGLDVRHLPYEACAIVLHTGATASQGHCCAVLLEEGIPRFITHDGKRATKAKSKDTPEICQKAYLIILKPSMTSPSSFQKSNCSKSAKPIRFQLRSST